MYDSEDENCSLQTLVLKRKRDAGKQNVSIPKLKVKIKPKVCKTGTKVKKKKKKKKFSTFCTECKTNEETLQKLVIHVNKWHKVSSMKVRLDFLVTF